MEEKKGRYEKIRKIKDDLARDYLLKLAVDAHLREKSEDRINLGAVCNLLADRIIALEGWPMPEQTKIEPLSATEYGKAGECCWMRECMDNKHFVI